MRVLPVRSSQMSPTVVAAVNLNGPGRYLHWSIFTVSEANLVLIAVMVVIFGAALVVPFPRPHHRGGPQRLTGNPLDGGRAAPEAMSSTALETGDDADAAMWTARLRRRAMRMLPPG